MTIGYQGEPGAYSEEALHATFPAATPQAYRTLRHAFHRVADQSVAFALVPVTASSFAAADTTNYQELEKFMSVYERVKANYVEPVDDHTLIKGAIDGMLAALDPHSSYAEASDFDLLLPACAAAHEEEIGLDPLRRDPEGFRWRTRAQIEEARSWIWLEDGVIRFKAEASAWTPSAVQLQQVWVDPRARRRGYARRALADLCRLLLEHVPAVCLFVRPENTPALGLYDSIGMTRELTYRSLVF